MRQTINDTTYDTANSTEVAHFSDGRTFGDPLHVAETLYRNGQVWFIHRRKGREHDELDPITPEQARTWLKQKSFNVALAHHFGEVVRRPQAATVL